MKAPKSELAKQLLRNPSTAHALRLAVERAVSSERREKEPRSSFIVKDGEQQHRISVEVVPIAS